MLSVTSSLGLQKKTVKSDGNYDKPNSTSPLSLYGFISVLPVDVKDRILSPREELVKDIFQAQERSLHQANPEAQRVDTMQALKINLLTRHSYDKNNGNNRFLRESLIENHMPLFDALLQTTENPDLPGLIKLAALRENAEPLRKLLSKVKEPLPGDVLQWVADCGQPEMLDKLLEKAPPDLSQAEQDALKETAQRQEEDITRLKRKLISQNQVVLRQAVNQRVEPALEALSRCLILALLRAGANANVVDGNGSTPLHFAAMWGNTVHVKLLLQAGANVNAGNVGGSTPLHFAASGGNTVHVKLLLQAGANVNVVDGNGSTPLHQAACWGNEASVEPLLQAGAKVNAVDAEGKTPLHLAAWSGREANIKLLLQAGANVNAVDANGNTPLQQAKMRRGNESVEKLLRQHGAKE